VTSFYLEVVSANGGKALNHFNKVHKGELVAALVADMPDDVGPEKFVTWCLGAGMDARIDDSRIVLAV
jgi:hypothetical protein